MTGGRKPRYDFYELFDAGNVSLDDDAAKEPKPLDPSSARAHANRGNGLFHVDSSFNPRRASFSLLRAVQLPPPGTGGDTMFADSRTAAEELPSELRALISGEVDASDKNDGDRDNHEEKERGDSGLIGVHSMAHSRKLGSPSFFADLDPTRWPMFRHRILQRHGPSGRINLYVGAHMHHIEKPSQKKKEASSSHDQNEREEVPDSWALVQRLNAHVTQDKYVVSVQWHQPGDLIIWDNRAVLHRAGPGTFQGKYIRDLRRTTVHDDSETAWGENVVGSAFHAFYTPPPAATPTPAPAQASADTAPVTTVIAA
jgi:alpha-ketoglutarate-dependent 2,4-dichlorophenoxyacetate dioxygenase